LQLFLSLATLAVTIFKEKRVQTIQNKYQLILEMNKLKGVFRNTKTNPDRHESTAEHSWSVSMITIILMDQLKKEFGEIDELKTIKLSLIHDVVEIYAGDVMAFDVEARKNKEKVEIEALKKLMAICPEFGQQLHDLWFEFEKKESLEAQIAKAADAICPIFLRLQSQQSYVPYHITIADMEKIKYPSFVFSETFMALYQQLKTDLLRQGLIENI
jgi:putative hydrolases of HD superfamily